MNHIGCITTDRTHLAELAKGLAAALPLDMIRQRYSDPRKPMIIALNGTQADGKKIFPDFITASLLASKKDIVKGRINWNEIHTSAAGTPFQISFINPTWNECRHTGYSDPHLDSAPSQRALLQMFHAKRTHSGIGFVQNGNKFVRQNAAIEIWLESAFSPVISPVFNAPLYRRLPRQPESLRKHFFEVTAHNTWVRWCEIKVNDRYLLKYPPLYDFMDTLDLPDSCASLKKPWYTSLLNMTKSSNACAEAIPQYGVNLPCTCKHR